MPTNAPAAAPPVRWARPVPGDAPPVRPLPRRWPRRLLAAAITVLLGLALLFTTAAAGRIDPADPAASAAAAPSAGTGPIAAAVTAQVVPGGSDPATAVPPGFADFRGYIPVAEQFSDGTVRMVNPDGACSVPTGGTRFRFDAACRAHDYGYDLLRYATATGQPLPGDARKLVDGRFAGDLAAQCQATRTGLSELGCQVTADVYAAGTSLNSWRQGFGNPGKETLPVSVLAAVAPLAAAPLVVRARRRNAARRQDRIETITTDLPAAPEAVFTSVSPRLTEEPAR